MSELSFSFPLPVPLRYGNSHSIMNSMLVCYLIFKYSCHQFFTKHAWTVFNPELHVEFSANWSSMQSALLNRTSVWNVPRTFYCFPRETYNCVVDFWFLRLPLRSSIRSINYESNILRLCGLNSYWFEANSEHKIL